MAYNNNLKVFFVLILLATAIPSLAHNGYGCSHMYKKKVAAAKATVASPEEDYYDVKYVQLDLQMNSTSTDITGDVTTHAQVRVSSLSQYVFELSSQLTIDAVYINGTPAPSITQVGSIVQVALPLALSQNSMFTARVQYHGQTTAGTGFFTRGLNLATLSTGTKLMYTLSDMYTAEDWWPAKQSIQDKIDSADIWVTVPDSLKAGSNGLLQHITPMSGNKSRYEWKTRYPIEYYLISVSVAPYSDYSYYMHYTDGSGDSMLIQNYVYDSASFMTPARKAAFDTTGLIVDHFSKLFGRYPFYKEKYGHCMAEPLGGGMEHQTMTTLAYAQSTLIAHELGHQWWGDHVTYGTWADIWLSEGFASYCEQLFVEHFWGEAAAKSYRTGVFNRVMGSAGGTLYVDDTTQAWRVFDSRLTYAKGASVAHMLRYMAPHDSLYFKLLRNYQSQYAFGLAVTEDLHTMAEQVYGIDLDTFFSQWVYKEGYPTYGLKWYQDGNKVYLQINQTTSKPSSVSVFAMPVEIQLKSANGDTVVRVYNDMATQNYSLNWDKTITGLAIDPDNQILNKNGSIANDPKLSVAIFDVDNIKVFPNPAGDTWQISGLPSDAELELTDIYGRKVWKGRSRIGTIPAKHLPAGIYILTIQVNSTKPHQLKLVKE